MAAMSNHCGAPVRRGRINQSTGGAAAAI